MNLSIPFWRRLPVAFIFLCWVSTPAHAQRENIGQTYQQAVELFERGQDRAALQLLRRIVAKSPGYRAAYYLMGRIHYRDNQITKAAKNFLTAGVGTVTAAGAFEFGVAMYSIGRYNEASKALKKVPAKSPNRNLANFYLGVVAYRLGNYTSAEFYLRRARKLPDEFAEYRSRVLQAIRGARTGAINPYSYSPGTANSYSTPQVRAGAKPEPEKDQSEVVKRGNFYDFTPKIAYQYSQSKADKHGFSFDERSKRGAVGRLDFSGRGQRSPRAGLASYGINASSQYKKLASTGRTVQFGKTSASVFSFEAPISNYDPTDSSVQFYLVPFTTHGLGRASSATFDAGLIRVDYLSEKSAATTVFAKSSLTIDYESADWITDFRVMRLGDPSGSRFHLDLYSVFDYDFDSFTAGTKLGFDSSSNSGASFGFPEEGSYTVAGIGDFESRLYGDLHLTRSWDSVSGKLTGAYRMLNAPKGTVGDYGDFRLASELTIQFAFGISVTGNLSYTMIPYAVRNVLTNPSDVINKVPEPRERTKVEASLDRLIYGAKITAAPGDGVLANFSITQTTDTYQANKKENQSILTQGTADQTLASAFLLELSLTF